MAAFAKLFTPTWHNTSYPSIDPSRPELLAKGKVVLITGGGSGLGKVTAKSFAKANARAIIITGRTESSLLETKVEIEKSYKNTIVRTFVGDVTDLVAVPKIFAAVKEEFGAVDVVVSNAGYLSQPGPFANEDIEEAWKGMEINVKGTFNVVGAFVKVASPNATLINVTSGVANVYIPGYQSYAASKIAVQGWLEYIQREFDSIRMVSVHPGIVDTSMNNKSGMPAQDNESLPADFKVWVCSPEAAFLKGKIVFANWDVDELIARKDEIIKGHLLELGLRGYERYY